MSPPLSSFLSLSLSLVWFGRITVWPLSSTLLSAPCYYNIYMKDPKETQVLSTTILSTFRYKGILKSCLTVYKVQMRHGVFLNQIVSLILHQTLYSGSFYLFDCLAPRFYGVQMRHGVFLNQLFKTNPTQPELSFYLIGKPIRGQNFEIQPSDWLALLKMKKLIQKSSVPHLDLIHHHPTVMDQITPVTIRSQISPSSPLCVMRSPYRVENRKISNWINPVFNFFISTSSRDWRILRTPSTVYTFIYRVFILDLYKRWASPRKKLARLDHETSYLEYSIPSFKVPGVFGALAPWETERESGRKSERRVRTFSAEGRITLTSTDNFLYRGKIILSLNRGATKSGSDCNYFSFIELYGGVRTGMGS
eukprot:sb/3465949/